MNITLCEDDSLFHGGTPQLVVLVVKFDNGNTTRIPYEACKTIASLYQDLYAIAPQVETQSIADITGDLLIKEYGGEKIPAVVAPKEPTKDKVPSE